MLGMPESSGYELLKRQQEKRKQIMLGILPHNSFWSSVVLRFNFMQKISDDLRKIIDDWIRKHHHVIHSPNHKDTILVKDKDNPTAPPVLKVKLLLQCSTDELLDDLYSDNLGLGDKVCDSSGGKLVSANMLRILFPPELKFVSNRYKQFCCCEYCVSMDYIQDALNRYRFELRKKLQADFDLLPEQTPSQKRKKKEGGRFKKIQA